MATATSFAAARALKVILSLREGMIHAQTLLLRLPIFWKRRLKAFFPGVVGHAVDDFTRLVFGQLQVSVTGRLGIPLGQAVSTEPRQIHQVDILHVGALLKVRN